MKIKNKPIVFLSIFLILIILFVKVYFFSKIDKAEISFFAFDTNVLISLYEESTEIDYSLLLDDCKNIVDGYEDLFSRTYEDSELYKINNRENSKIECSIDTAFLFFVSKKFYKETNEKFDISVGCLVDEWTDARENAILPTEIAIKTAKETTKNINYNMTFLDSDGIEKNCDIIFDEIYENIYADYIDKLNDLKNKKNYKFFIEFTGMSKYDFGAIAKGYVADQLKYELKKWNINGLINFGGNVLCIGEKPKNKKYNIGINKPFSNGEIIGKIELVDETAVTSGVYQRYVEIDNKIYSHIIDTETGYPIDNELLSVTVVCKNSIVADVLSTTFMILGVRDSEKYVDELRESGKDLKVYFIDDEYNYLEY